MKKEWRIIDKATNQVIKTFDNFIEGYKEGTKLAEELEAQGKQPTLIYRQCKVKKEVK